MLIWYYLIIINMFTFFLYGFDKYKARKGAWRIPESRLLFFAAIGGSAGALIGMFVWHHKTKHAKFYIGVPLIMGIQILLILLCPLGPIQR